MKKLILCAMILALTAGILQADTKLPVVQYKCRDCGQFFYSFYGDDLEKVEYTIPSNQTNRIFKLSNYQVNLPGCKGKATHYFEKTNQGNQLVSAIMNHANVFAVIKDGPKLNGIKFSSWWCKYPECHDPFIIYSLGDDNFIIRDWEQQPDRIINCKTLKGITKCQAPDTPGHAFFFDAANKDHNLSSYELAKTLEDVYFVIN